MRVLMMIAVAIVSVVADAQSTAYFYTGGYTKQLPEGEREQAGIVRWSLDVESGEMKQDGATIPAVNPSFLRYSPDRSVLYAVSEVGSIDGKPTGAVTTYAVDESGKLEQRETTASNGPAPCYLATDVTGKRLMLANYGGSIASFSLGGDGVLDEQLNGIAHEGSSVDESRQTAAHPHSIVPTPEGDIVFVPDLGMDKLVAYRVDPASGKFTSDASRDVATPPGSGPRHLIFHPTLPFAYCSLEMGNQVAVYRYEDGQLSPIGYFDSLPEDFDGASTTAEVRIHPNGRVLYISNRGHDSIAVFGIDAATGLLTAKGYTSTQGKTPRNFALDATGRVMVVANQQSDSLVSFFVNPEDGTLKATGQTVSTTAPTYVLF
jgi:6-phosphogluconolactonase